MYTFRTGYPLCVLETHKHACLSINHSTSLSSLQFGNRTHQQVPFPLQGPASNEAGQGINIFRLSDHPFSHNAVSICFRPQQWMQSMFQAGEVTRLSHGSQQARILEFFKVRTLLFYATCYVSSSGRAEKIVPTPPICLGDSKNCPPPGSTSCQGHSHPKLSAPLRGSNHPLLASTELAWEESRLLLGISQETLTCL